MRFFEIMPEQRVLRLCPYAGVWDKHFDPKNTVKGTFLNGGHKAYATEADFMTMLEYQHYAYYPK